MLMSLEKQTRTGSDMHSTARVLVTIVQLCFNAEVCLSFIILSCITVEI